jgi:hypothetical protein
MNAIDMPFVAQQEHIAAQNRTQHFHSTEQLLTEGGDARITLNPATLLNKYGCHPYPNTSIAAFGSATATTISETSFIAANQLRNRLEKNVVRDDAAEVYADEMNRIRQELNDLCGLRNSGVDIVFAASGTDVHLIASQLAAKDESVPVRMLMVDTAETGTGVTAALSGRHFSNRTALGDSVSQGAMIGREDHGQVVAIPVRLADGTPRPSAAIDADFERHVAAAVAAGERVLLTLVDVSKTGLIAPSVACAIALHKQYPDALEVLVDACQFRLTPTTLQTYLAQGFLVGITGSKFISGPSFAGALLIPPALSKELRSCAELDKLQAYSARADWPVTWRSAKCLDELPNFGLLLRWEGAVKELRAFRSLSNIVTMHFLEDFAAAIRQRMESDPIFEILPVPELKRFAFSDTPSWDSIQTIFPFLLRHPENSAGKTLLSSEEMVQVYQVLQEGINGNDRVQLGQPVDCGRRDGITVSALRLCVSSRLVVEALQQNGRNQQVVIDRALKALDTVAQLVRTMKDRK